MVTQFVSYFGREHVAFFVGKHFVVRISTTKTTKILPPKNGIYACLKVVVGQTINTIAATNT